MKAIVLRRKEDLVVADVPKPEPGRGEALVQVTDCGICGSDIRYLHGENPWAQHTLGEFRANPENIIPGHEVAGVVAAVGEGGDAGLIGKRVGVLCFKVDETCPWCRSDMRHLCMNTVHLGHGAGQHGRDYYYGGMAEYVPVWAEHCFPLPDSVSNEDAALLDPFCVGLHAVRDMGRASRSSSSARGRSASARSCAPGRSGDEDPRRDIKDGHLALAKKFGADAAVNVEREDLKQAVLDFTSGLGAWLVADSVGMVLAQTTPPRDYAEAGSPCWPSRTNKKPSRPFSWPVNGS